MVGDGDVGAELLGEGESDPLPVQVANSITTTQEMIAFRTSRARTIMAGNIA
jgi:hypothetical protein